MCPIGARVEMAILSDGTRVVPQASYPSCVILRALSAIYRPSSCPKSSGVIHRISPSQYAGTPVKGVAPLTMVAVLRRRRASQCSGTSPSHSTPEGL